MNDGAGDRVARGHFSNKLSAVGVTPETFQLQDVRAGDAITAAAATAAPAGGAAHRGRNTHTHIHSLSSRVVQLHNINQ